jgi:hypothetical protein
MGDLTPIREGLRPIGHILPNLVAGLFEQLKSLSPRYGVRDGMIVNLTTGRGMTVEKARQQAALYLDDALTTRHSDLVDLDLIHVAHLVRAIRVAEGLDPEAPPPAAAARAA